MSAEPNAHGLAAHAHHEEHDDEEHNKAGERRTRVVVWLSLVMMVGELVVGNMTGSMALTADGWHMGTHVGALGLTLVAYWYARSRAGNDKFSFGTGKVYALAGYTSGVLLALISLWMVVESIHHMLEGEVPDYNEALAVATLGFVVNISSVVLLGKGHHYGHSHAGHSHGVHGHDDHDHGHAHGAHAHGASHAEPASTTPEAGTLDFNMRAAYIHVLADAMTSLMAIFALSMGKFFGLWFLDPTMGIVGAVVIFVWAVSLCRQASGQLLDVVDSKKHIKKVREILEAIDDVKVADLHVWELGPARRSCIVSLVTSTPREVDFYRKAVTASVDLVHLTIEIHNCDLPHDEHREVL